MSRPPTESETRLFDCALTLFATQGYSGISVREIIESVGLTKPVLYYYCESKLDLFTKLIDRVHCEALRGLEEQVRGEGDPQEKLRAILHGTFTFCRADWRIPRLMYGVAFGPKIPQVEEVITAFSDRRYALIREVIEEGVRLGILVAQDLDVLALGFCSIMDHPVNVMTRDRAGAQRLTPELAEALFAVFTRGACKPE